MASTDDPWSEPAGDPWTPPPEPPEDPYEETEPEITSAHRPLAITVEERLLGALLQSPDAWRLARERVRGIEFSSPVLGGVFDQFGAAIERGERLLTETVYERFADWKVRGLTPGDPYRWDDVDVVPLHAGDYADTIRAGYLRMEGDRVLGQARSDLRDSGASSLTVLSEARKHLDGLIDSSTRTHVPAQLLSEVLDVEENYDWTIPGLLERRDRFVLTGMEGGGKSTLMRQLALCAAAGLQPFDATPMEPQRVLVIDVENSIRQWRRQADPWAKRLVQHGVRADPRQRVFLVATSRMDLTKPEDMAIVHRYLDDTQPDIVVIGPLYRLVPRAITTDDDAAPLLAALDSFREHGATLLIEAHAGKATDSEGDRNMAPRGSAALLGWPEFGFGMRPLPKVPDMVRFVPWRGARENDRSWPLHLRRGEVVPWVPADPEA